MSFPSLKSVFTLSNRDLNPGWLDKESKHVHHVATLCWLTQIITNCHELGLHILKYKLQNYKLPIQKWRLLLLPHFAPQMALLGFFIERWVFHTISTTDHLIPPPVFKLTSESCCTSLRDLHSGRSTDWATAAAAQNWRLNIFFFFSSGIDDMFVIMQAWNNSENQVKADGKQETRDLQG